MIPCTVIVTGPLDQYIPALAHSELVSRAGSKHTRWMMMMMMQMTTIFKMLYLQDW